MAAKRSDFIPTDISLMEQNDNCNKRKREISVVPHINELTSQRNEELLRSLLLNQMDRQMKSNATSLDAHRFLSQMLAGTSRLEIPHQRLQLSSPSGFSFFDDIFRSQAVMSNPSHSITHRLAVSSLLQDLIRLSRGQAVYFQLPAASSTVPFTMTNALSLEGLQGFAAASDALSFPGPVQSVCSSRATDIFGLPNLPRTLQNCSAQPGSVQSTLDRFMLEVDRSQSYPPNEEERRQQKRRAIAVPSSSLRNSQESACDAAALLLAVKIMQRDGSAVSSQTVCQEEKALLLAIPDDELRLNEQQIFIRNQIEVFRATASEVGAHTRGRNKPVEHGQAGIRCKHCAHLSPALRQKGSTYFPSALKGLYQAAQNMSVEHLQSGICSEMPTSVKNQFAEYASRKPGPSGAGRPYWAEAGGKLGLVDTELGIRFAKDESKLPHARSF